MNQKALFAEALRCLVIALVSIALAGSTAIVASAQEEDESAMRSTSAQADEQTDLSGTYTGRVNYPDEDMVGEATLSIEGNNFTLTAGEKTLSGRITAVTTRGYTGVTMMFGDMTPQPAVPLPSTAPPAPVKPAISLRARKAGDRLTLTTAPGEKRRFSFTPPTQTGRRGRR